MDDKGADAFLGAGLEEVRYKVPKGKFRVVLVDMFDHTANIIQDFDDVSSAKKYVLDNEDMLGEYESLVIYDDEGKLLYDSDWEEERVDDETVDKFMDVVHRELGNDRFEEYVKSALALEKNAKSMEDIKEIAIQVDGTVQDKLKNLFFIYAFLGLVDAKLGGFIKSAGMAMEAFGFKDPKEVYEHIGEIKEITDDEISIISIAGLKFGYDFKHGS